MEDADDAILIVEDSLSHLGDTAEENLIQVATVTELATSGLRAMEDGFIDLLTTGRTSFSTLVNSVISDVARLVFRLRVVQPLAEPDRRRARRHRAGGNVLRRREYGTGGGVRFRWSCQGTRRTDRGSDPGAAIRRRVCGQLPVDVFLSPSARSD